MHNKRFTNQGRFLRSVSEFGFVHMLQTHFWVVHNFQIEQMISDCLWNEIFNLYYNTYRDSKLDRYNDHKPTSRENISYLFKPFSTFVFSSSFSIMIFGLSSTLHSSYEITFIWCCPSESVNGAEEGSLEISSTPFVFSESIKCWKLS